VLRQVCGRLSTAGRAAARARRLERRQRAAAAWLQSGHTRPGRPRPASCLAAHLAPLACGRAPPTPVDHGAHHEGPAEWYAAHKKTMQAHGLWRPASAAALQGRDASSRYQRCARNPGVGFDRERKKFTLMVVENGVDKPFGSFLTEDEGVEGCTAMIDKRNRGPHGIQGIPRTNKLEGVPKEVLMEANGPPGVQLNPTGHWQKNEGAKNTGGRNVNVGNWTTPQSQPVVDTNSSERHVTHRAMRPASASLLAGRPTAARRQRPSTALLRDKGQWTGKREDHQQEVVRRDLCGALDGERVEYNPETMKNLWAGGWINKFPQPPAV
jgi:hypothetical protein